MNPTLKSLMHNHGLHRYVTEDCQHRMEVLASLVAEHCAQICMSQADRRNIRSAFGLAVDSTVKYPSPATTAQDSQYNRTPNLPKG